MYGGTMTTPRVHVPTRRRLSRDTLALIDETIAKAREESRLARRDDVLRHPLSSAMSVISMKMSRHSGEKVAEIPLRWPVEYYEEFRRLGVEIAPW